MGCYLKLLQSKRFCHGCPEANCNGLTFPSGCWGHIKGHPSHGHTPTHQSGAQNGTLDTDKNHPKLKNS